MGQNLKKYFRWYLLLVFIILSFILWNIALSRGEDGILTFAVLDVGQGDSIFIKSPTGTQVLVDGGPGNAISREINKVVPWYDRSLDMIVITNPDSDHYEGFIKLLDKYSIKNVLEPGTTNKYAAYGILEDKIKQKNIAKTLARRGQVIDIGGGAYLQILFPDRDISGLSPNDGSIVMKLVYGETSVMLQGDSTSRMEEYLMSLGTTTLDSTLLKAGHHGSKTSSSKNYVAAVSPEFTIISSGKNNEYGHPHKEVLETLNSLNIKSFSTCNNGTILFKSDGKTFVLKNKNPVEATVGCKI